MLRGQFQGTPPQSAPYFASHQTLHIQFCKGMHVHVVQCDVTSAGSKSTAVNDVAATKVM